MTRAELHTALSQYLYIEDFGMVDIILASILANSMRIGDPVWLTLIGPSSAGKSQLIRPLHLANPNLIHPVDDLTSNTLLSGTLGLEGSLLGRIGEMGILSMDDLTVLFSKNNEQRAEILSQFRMLYDGRFSKSSGARKEPIVWEGYLGMIAGSTPSIYRFFSEVADMGERFLSYRMRAIDTPKAVEFVDQHPYTAKEMNEQIADLFREYLKGIIVSTPKPPDLPSKIKDSIKVTAQNATLLRTPVHVDERSGLIDDFPVSEMPFRVQKQLTSIAQALYAIALNDNPDDNHLPNDLHKALDWTAYSLANDKRRSYFRAVVRLYDDGKEITSRNVSAYTGLHTEIVKRGLDQLTALNIISLKSEDQGTGKKVWDISNLPLAQMVRRIDPLDSIQIHEDFD